MFFPVAEKRITVTASSPRAQPMYQFSTELFITPPTNLTFRPEISKTKRQTLPSFEEISFDRSPEEKREIRGALAQGFALSRRISHRRPRFSIPITLVTRSFSGFVAGLSSPGEFPRKAGFNLKRRTPRGPSARKEGSSPSVPLAVYECRPGTLNLRATLTIRPRGGETRVGRLPGGRKKARGRERVPRRRGGDRV